MNKPIEAIPVPRNIYQKLNDSRAEFHAMKLKKSGHNKFAGYFYFELADFLIPALQVFQKNGLCANVSFTPEFATLQIVNIENTAEVIVFASPMAEANLKGCHPIQNLGAVETYQRRYLWVMALEIVEHDSIDSSEPTAKTPKTVAKDTHDKLGEEEQQFLKDQAMEVLANWPDEQKTYDAYIAVKKSLDADEQVAFWSFFDSKQRSAIKKIGAQELAGQS